MASCPSTPNDSDNQPTLVDLLIESGIASPHTFHETALNTDWVFCEDISRLDPAISAACAKQLEFVRAFKSGWASSESHALGIPEKWELDANSKTWILSDHMHAAALLRWLRPIQGNLTFISTDDIVKRHDNSKSFLPDFLLHAPHILDYPIETESYDWTSSTYSLPFFMEIISYPGDEASADMAIPGFFQPTPNCTLVSDVVYDFPPPLSVRNQHYNKTFAVVENSFRPLTPSHYKIIASLLRPTLLVGMKGPARWPAPLANLIRMSQSASVPASLDQTLLDLAQSIEPNLFALLMNWHYRCERNIDGIGEPSLPSYRCIPTWLIQFGLIYDAEGLIIVAHIPYLATPSSPTSAPLSFLSCIVDRISMPGLIGIRPSSTSYDASILSNLRAALALSCLQRHAFVVSALLEGVSWPSSIVQKDAEDEGDLEDGSTSSDADEYGMY